MVRMTLHEAQTAVAALSHTASAVLNASLIDWTQPAAMAVFVTSARHMANRDDVRKALDGIADALLAYHTHLAFEAGRAFSDAASIAYVDAEATRVSAATYRLDGGAVLTVLASELRDGLHYAEPEGT